MFATYTRKNSFPNKVGSKSIGEDVMEKCFFFPNVLIIKDVDYNSLFSKCNFNFDM